MSRTNRKFSPEFKIGESKLYLSPIIDLYNGEILAIFFDFCAKVRT